MRGPEYIMRKNIYGIYREPKRVSWIFFNKFLSVRKYSTFYVAFCHLAFLLTAAMVYLKHSAAVVMQKIRKRWILVTREWLQMRRKCTYI